jgi:hypothetical protein
MLKTNINSELATWFQQLYCGIASNGVGVHVFLEIHERVKNVEYIVFLLLGCIYSLLEVHEVFPTLHKVGQTHAGVQLGQVDHTGAEVEVVVLVFIVHIVMLVRSVDV